MGRDRLQTNIMTSFAKQWCLSLLFKTKPMIFHFLPYGFSDISVSGEIATPTLFSKKIVKTAYALCENRCLSVNAIEKAVRRSAPKRVPNYQIFCSLPFPVISYREFSVLFTYLLENFFREITTFSSKISLLTFF